MTAVAITRGLPNKNYYLEAKAVHDWIQRNIRYVRDVRDVETLSTKAADCDDHVILNCSLLEAIGHPTKMVAIGPAPNNFVHVFTQTKIGRSWVSSDTTEPKPFGWTPRLPFSLEIYN